MPSNPDITLLYRKSRKRSVAYPITAKKTSDKSRMRVGVWDMNARAGTLPKLLDYIEQGQTYLSFYHVEAAYQTGLTSPGDHVVVGWKQRTGRKITRAAASSNILAQPIFNAAEPIRRKLPIDWLVVLVKWMIADDSDLQNLGYNLFSTHQKKVVLVSTYDLRRYAAEAGRPFETAVAASALAELLNAMFPAIRFQDETTGSIFDYCEKRSDVVQSIRKLKIDSENRARIPAPVLSAVDGILVLLSKYKGDVSASVMRRQKRYFASVAPEKAVPRAMMKPLTSDTRALAGAARKSSGSVIKDAPPSVAFGDILKELAVYRTDPPQVLARGGKPARKKRVRKRATDVTRTKS